MESSGPPPIHPRTFPHPLEILGARPPPAQDSHSSHSRDDEGYTGKKDKKRGTKPTNFY
jgi:hypothetical protein